MNAPFFKFGLFGDEASLIVAFIIGIGFGFFLERAGFGSGRKLAAQFYFTDMTVFKVMFTAIVTAMLGLFWLSVLGVVDLSLVYVSQTYLAPQIVGGLILGVGFVIGGYCPGTSCVSAATGRYDAMIYILGIIAGVFVFGEAYPLLKDFYSSGAMGKVTLPELFGVSYGLVVFLVVLMAVGGFVGAEWVEKKLAAKVKGVQQ
ncbi:MAG: YeeE/YedE family protein [Ignavibacteriae bacterium]|nr:YeeE/YedE family protein [Ignavibacteriota bacterium]